MDVVKANCDQLDNRTPLADGSSRRKLIVFVSDRAGHDRRYAVDTSRIMNELGRRPGRTFEQGLSETIDWYLSNEAWWQACH